MVGVCPDQVSTVCALRFRVVHRDRGRQLFVVYARAMLSGGAVYVVVPGYNRE